MQRSAHVALPATVRLERRENTLLAFVARTAQCGYTFGIKLAFKPSAETEKAVRCESRAAGVDH